MRTKNFDFGKKARGIATTGIIGLSAFVLNPAHAFDASNVMSISHGGYLESVGKQLSDYTLKGVHGGFSYPGCLENLIKKVNKNYPDAEVVVNFEYSFNDSGLCYGMVLIPREE